MISRQFLSILLLILPAVPAVAKSAGLLGLNDVRRGQLLFRTSDAGYYAPAPLVATEVDIAEMGLIAPIVGHAGDGNFHVLALMDPENAGEVALVERFVARLNMRAIAMEGTCTGEHGVGQGKVGFLRAEHGHGLDVMRQIKRALDPDNIMNPGKILPA